jgi:hypothetical protein
MYQVNKVNQMPVVVQEQELTLAAAVMMPEEVENDY